MGAAHLPSHRHVEAFAQSVGIFLIGTKPHRFDVVRRPVSMLRGGAARLDAHDMRRTNSKNILVDSRLVFGVIEHEEIGEFFLA